MNLEQMRARLAEITNSLKALTEKTELSTDDTAQITALNQEYDQLEPQLTGLEKAQANIAKASAPQRQTSPQASPSPRVEIIRDAKDRFGGFNSSGSFLMAVKNAAGGKIDPIFQSVAYEKNGEDGGYLIPEDIRTEIVTKIQDDTESLWGKANTYQVSGNSLSLTLDESQPWNQGIQSYWVEEGGVIPDTKPKFTRAAWRLKKLAALVKCTDELLEDAVALESYIKRSAPASMMYKINDAVLSGNGVGKPEGILNSAFRIAVAKKVGQAADTIVAQNIIDMYTRMIPSSRPRAAWYINAQAEGQLMGMKDDNGNYIYLTAGTAMNTSPFATLLGRPVIPMMGAMKALGDEGDIMFGDLSYYYGISKAGIKSATSIHLHFDREITAFRFSYRLDGQVPFKSPVTTQYGNHTMSAFVTLEDRT